MEEFFQAQVTIIPICIQIKKKRREGQEKHEIHFKNQGNRKKKLKKEN